ncbi:hypothetical protein ACXR0O_12650 [Verrucomicrobiota bacterium sgz303538]
MDRRHSDFGDDVRMTADELADSIGVSRAFVQLIIDAGYPVRGCFVVRDELFDWFGINSDRVRKIAGLPYIPPISDCSIMKMEDVQETRAMRTMLDFMHARACSEETRKLCEKLARNLHPDR